MVGRLPRSRALRLGITLLGVVVLLSGLIGAPRTDALVPPHSHGPGDPAGRIAYSGTEHRSLGIALGLPAQPGSAPVFPGPQQHFEEDPYSRAGLLVFTGLMDQPTPQVYLRDRHDHVHRLTADRDAAHPQLSPNLQWVAFDSAEPGTQRDVWLVRTDGTAVYRLTSADGNETHPTFSADGTRVAYASDRDGRWQIYEQPVAGGAARKLTNEPSGAAIDPSWNPNPHLDQIAYTVDADGDLADNSDQSVQVRAADGTSHALLDGFRSDWQSRQPQWMPDGLQLLLVSNNDIKRLGDPPDDISRVYVVHNHPRPYPTLLLAEDRLISSPTWHLDDAHGHVVVSRTTAPHRNFATLQDIRPDGSDPRDLDMDTVHEDRDARTDANRMWVPQRGFDPWSQRETYSPNGKLIAVSRFVFIHGRQTQRVWLTDADGSHPRPLHTEDHDGDRDIVDWETDPVWSPDGTQLALARRTPGAQVPWRGRSRIIIVDVRTGHVTRQLESPSPDLDDTQPAWSPDGNTLAFSRGRVDDVPPGQARNNHIWVADATTLGNQRDVTALSCAGCQGQVVDDSPAFAPDGRSIAFNRETDGLVRFYLDGRCQVLLPAGQQGCATVTSSGAQGPFQPRDIAWGPDGRQLVLSERRAQDPNSPERLSVLDLPSGRLTSLTGRLPGRQKEPTWQRSANLAIGPPGGGTEPPPDSGKHPPSHPPGPWPPSKTPTPTPTPPPGDQPPTSTPQPPPGDQPPTSTPTPPTSTPEPPDNGQPQPGDVIVIPIEVHNGGPSDSFDTGVSSAPSPGLQLVDLTTTQGTCDLNAAECAIGTLPVGGTVTVTGTFRCLTPGPQQVVWTVTGTMYDPSPDDSQETVPVYVYPPDTFPPPAQPPTEPPPPPPPPGQGPDPAVEVVANPNPSYVGGQTEVIYTVRNLGDAPATGLSLDMTPPAGVPVFGVPVGCSATQCTLPDLPPGGVSSTRLVLTPNAPVDTVIIGMLRTTGADQQVGNDIAVLPYRVLQPRIVVNPAVGEPGFVTSVRGEDFPPGTPVQLAWLPGITAAAAPVLAGPDGRFAGQLLILTKDQTGPRTITASGPGFSPVSFFPFLVVHPSATPPDLIGRR